MKNLFSKIILKPLQDKDADFNAAMLLEHNSCEEPEGGISNNAQQDALNV